LVQTANGKAKGKTELQKGVEQPKKKLIAKDKASWIGVKLLLWHQCPGKGQQEVAVRPGANEASRLAWGEKPDIFNKKHSGQK